MTAIKLGTTVKDRFTGFTGTATKRLEVVAGSAQYLIEGRDNGFRRDEWLDEGRLELAESKPLASVSSLVPTIMPPPTLAEDNA